MSGVWGTTESMPFSAETIAAATAAGVSQIVELPCGNYISGFNADTGSSVPQTVTSFQFKAALVQLGFYATVLAYITNTAPLVDQLAWAEVAEFNRPDTIIATIAAALNYTSAQIDAVFVAAAQINP